MQELPESQAFTFADNPFMNDNTMSVTVSEGSYVNGVHVTNEEGQWLHEGGHVESTNVKPEDHDHYEDNAGYETRGGLDLSGFSQEYAVNGRLSEASFDALEGMGLPRNLVETYIEGLAAPARLEEYQAHSLVGGTEEYNDMIEWASLNLTDEAIADFDHRIEHAGQTRELAIKELYEQYKEETGTYGDVVMGGSGSVSSASSNVYNNMHELASDLSDPRYDKDPAFRRAVENKLLRSPL